MGAALDGDGLVDDVTLNARRGGQADFQTTDTTDDATVDHNVISNHFAFDRGALADGQKVGANVALNRAFN